MIRKLGLVAVACLALGVPAGSAQEITNFQTKAWGDTYAAFQKALKQHRPDKVTGESPPLDVARARLIYKADPAEGAFQFWLAFYRMQWDAFHCSDRTAPQGVTIIMMDLNARDPEFLQAVHGAPLKLSAHKRILSEGAIFARPSKPLWICSHGISSFMGPAGIVPDDDPQLQERRARVEPVLRKVVETLEGAPGVR